MSLSSQCTQPQRPFHCQAKTPLSRRFPDFDEYARLGISPLAGLEFAPFLADGCGWSIGPIPFASPLSGYVSLQLLFQDYLHG
jgi:hypothetical protein